MSFSIFYFINIYSTHRLSIQPPIPFPVLAQLEYTYNCPTMLSFFTNQYESLS